MIKRIIPLVILIVALIATAVFVLEWRQQLAQEADESTPSANQSQTPTPTPLDQNKPSASETPQPVQQTVEVFLVSLESPGSNAFGCGDALEGVTQQLTTTSPLADSIRTLLAIDDEYFGESGLYNALWQSDLILERASISNGVAKIELTGTLKLGGTCDSPRVEEQLKATATQFATVTSTNITLNGQPLQQALSTQ